ncbi:xanthotoxin 5-hydroxylase CYP82C2-like [Punica granatum]|uniref:Uncharacterized protein n=2 Tax=Punica granatum TaxID=22663 RepID=A0A218WPR6_PUNGR|nr:xanthotoxin 5-hydroxylase CYP82C2-like [Punica granatum]OWM74469.1 hypothetical protein CDL15_Pgr003972 [Punica granatum]PKI48664.1 hypothetical protein CRG98_030951 [Punica granatum]
MDMAILLLIFLIIFSYRFLRKKSNNVGQGKHAPEPDGAWPIIGHLRLLSGGDQLLYRTLGAMADKYGPTFSIRLGTRRALVISRWEEAKECFTINDKAFASRPILAATKLMCYDCAMFGLAPYSNYWREMRKMVNHELLTNSQLEKIRHVWEPEIDESMKELYNSICTEDNAQSLPINLTQWFDNLTLNVIVRLVAGKRFYSVSTDGCQDSEATRCQNAILQFFHLMGIFVVSDALPFLSWLDLQGHEKAMKETFKQLDPILEGWLQEHRLRRALCADGTRSEQDFIDVMLSIQETGRFSNFRFDADTCIKSTCLSTILGGGGTTPVTLTWAVSLLINNRRVLKKAQQELDTVVGPNRPVHESDIKNLPYIRAIIEETFRLYPPGPLLAPRECIEDCTVAGYSVPAGTRLVVNTWKIQRDPTVWTDPLEFRPERFLTSKAHVDALGPSFKLIPFGFGRRSCPGASFALHVLHLTLARLIHAFDLATLNDQPVDMTESPGLSLPKATPLEILLSPRVDKGLFI